MDVKVAKSLDEFAKAVIIRYKVFVVEQCFSEDIEIDEHEASATHLIAVDGGKVVGTARVYKEGQDVRLGRMAVEKQWRGKGVGRALVAAAKVEAKKIRGNYLVAHAQVQALEFYEKMGLKKAGEPYIEDGAPHVIVRCKL
nr:GNAT family N-acetyltransferase [Candidatus Sigynarchaeota archaeon]